MRALPRFAGCVAMLCLASVAEADNRTDIFGLGKRKVPAKPEPVPPAAGDPQAQQPATTAASSEPGPAPSVRSFAPFPGLTWHHTRAQIARLPGADNTHDALAGLAFGVGRDDVGLVIGGATGLETRYMVGDAPIDDVVDGGAGTGVPLLFIERLSVSVGGFSARYRPGTGGIVDVQLREGGERHRMEAWTQLGFGPQRTARPIAAPSYQLFRTTTETTAISTATVVADGPLGCLAGFSPWYAVGVSSSYRAANLTRIASRIVDRDNDGAPDTFATEAGTQYVTEPIYRNTVSADAFRIPAMLRLGLRNAKHAVTGTFLIDAASNSRFSTMAVPSAAQVDRTFVDVDGFLNYKLSLPRTQLSVTTGWRRSTRDESAGIANGEPQRLSAYVPESTGAGGVDLGAPDLQAACSDTVDDVYPNVPNCPIPVGWLALGGAGQLIDTVADRQHATLTLTQRHHRHEFVVGASIEDSRLLKTFSFTGGEYIRSLFPQHIDSERYTAPGETCSDDPNTPCTNVASVTHRFRTRNIAGYGEDTWNVAKGWNINGGLRWEWMEAGSQLAFRSQLAPRLSSTFRKDIGGSSASALKVKTRWFTGWSKSYAFLPLGVVDAIAPNPATVREVTSPFGNFRTIDPLGGYRVFEAVRPISVDEFSFASDLMVPGLAALHVWGQWRWQREALDTTDLGLSNIDRFSNAPPKNSQMIGAELRSDASSISSDNQRAGAKRRKKQSSTNFRVGFSFQRAIGSSVGPYDPAQGVVHYTGREFNYTSENVFGRLPTDLGKRFYADFARRTSLHGIPLEFGLRATLADGRVTNTIASTRDGVVFLLPRGASGRLPSAATVNARFAAQFGRFSVGIDLLNAFDRRPISSVDETYTFADVLAINGGERADLVFLRDRDGGVVARNPGYRLATSFAAPLFAALNVRAAL